MKVLALGGYGTFGRTVARNLSSREIVTEIVIAGRDLDAAKAFAGELGSKARAARVDASDEGALVPLATGMDLLVNTAGPDYVVSFPAARAAIQAGIHYCDLCADCDATERLLRFDADARSKGVTVLLGMGASPGETNLLMKHAASQLDEVEDLRLLITYNLFGMIRHMGVQNPAEAASEMRRTGKVNASWETVMKWGGGRVTVFENGELKDVDPSEHLERITLPGKGNAVFFPIGCPEAITIPRFLKNVHSASYMMNVAPPQVSDIYLSIADRIRRKQIDTREATILFHEEVGAKKAGESAPSSWLLPGTSITAVATGTSHGSRTRYSCSPAMEHIGASSALTVASLRILRGEIGERGVLAPEACFDPVHFMEEVASNDSGWTKGKKLFDETWERLR